jgi:hypothetical protein
MTVSHTPPDWVTALDPSPDAAIAHTRSLEGVDVEARWWITEGERWSPGTGPRQVVITINDDASPQVSDRGINSGVLRRVEQVVVEMSRTVAGPQTAAVDAYRERVGAYVRRLPDSPRSRVGDYYGALLSLYEFLETTNAHPVVELHRVLNENGRSISKETLNKQLQRARLKRAEGGEA